MKKIKEVALQLPHSGPLQYILQFVFASVAVCVYVFAYGLTFLRKMQRWKACLLPDMFRAAYTSEAKTFQALNISLQSSQL